jgi:ElaB/YqjD/DUF883 family membrane-anchored ribosome-binding protein
MTTKHNLGSDFASTVSDISSRVQNTASDLSQKASDAFEATTDYVGSNTIGDIAADVRRFVKANPTQALLGALVVGFLAGRMLRRG